MDQLIVRRTHGIVVTKEPACIILWRRFFRTCALVPNEPGLIPISISQNRRSSLSHLSGACKRARIGTQRLRRSRLRCLASTRAIIELFKTSSVPRSAVVSNSLRMFLRLGRQILVFGRTVLTEGIPFEIYICSYASVYLFL